MADFDDVLTKFHGESERLARRSFGRSVAIQSERRYNFMRIRIRIDSETFAELYTNAQNGRGSYALIHNNRRVFGYDGVKKWHRHPRENPEAHIACPKPRLPKVFREMKRIVDLLSSGE